jgi:hypothetical protein
VRKQLTVAALAVLIFGVTGLFVAYREWSSRRSQNSQAASDAVSTTRPSADIGTGAIAVPPPKLQHLRNPRELRRVPELTGRPISIARQLLRLADLELMEGVYFVADHSWRDDIQPEVAYLQSPPASTPIWAGQTVACWTFAKAEPSRRVVQVPDLRERTATAAAEELNAAELLVLPDALVETNAVGRTDLVRDQYPKAGQVVMVGTSVLLRYAKTSPEQRRW